MDISLLTSIYPFPKLTINKSKTESEIFSTNYRLVNHEELIKAIENLTESKKDSHVSAFFREKGNKSFKKGDYNAAFDFYYKSIGVAPLDSHEYGLALANRSAVLFANKNYKECLKDIATLLTVKYPHHKLGKIYLRQTECFLHLNQNHNAVEAWTNASDHIEKLKKIVGIPPRTEEVNSKIMDIIRKLDVFDVELREKEYPIPKLKNGENPKFLNASNAVELKNNLEIGRHVVAKIDIEPGDVLFVEKPYCAVRNNEQKIFCTYCSHCLSMSLANIPCEYCSVHFYCSENCRQEAWNVTHKWECYGERKQLLSCKLRLVLNILLKASYNNFKIDVNDESVYGNQEDNFPFVNRLITNKDKLTNEEINVAVKCAIIIVLYLKKFTDYFEWLHGLPENADKSLPFLYEAVGSTLLRICLQLSCNETEIVSTTILFKETPAIDIKFIGFGLYVSTAMLNHSCNPNTLVTFDKTLKVIRARDKIPKNTEITVDYCKYRSDNIVNYGVHILKKYKFNCPCAKCSNPCPLRHEELPWLCKKCKDKAFHVQTETYVQCVNPNCKHIFDIRKYKSIEAQISANLLDACVNVDTAAFENIHKKFKKIYHKDNVKFIGFYLNAYEFYLKHRIMEKCLNICKIFLQFCEQFNEVNDIKLLAHLRMMVALVVHHGSQVPLQPNVSEEINSIFKETKRLLSFYVPPNVIQQYEEHITSQITF